MLPVSVPLPVHSPRALDPACGRSILCTVLLLLLAGCASPTDPDTPRRRITDPSKTFIRIIDKSPYDLVNSLRELPDGGFIMTGRIWSEKSASIDALLIRTDREGKEVWTQSFGGVYEDFGSAVQTTSDGGFILAGSTESFSNGLQDLWVIKTDAAGHEMWSRSFGGRYGEGALDIRELADGGYIVAGYTQLNTMGSSYAWLLRLDRSGVEEWNRVYGAGTQDMATAVRETPDRGFLVSSFCGASGKGSSELWLFRTDAEGTVMWQKQYSGELMKTAMGLAPLSDGSCAVLENSSPPFIQSSDLQLALAAPNGDIVWENTLLTDAAGAALAALPDGGFVIAGYTSPFNRGNSEIALIRADARGRPVWLRRFGSGQFSRAFCLTTTADGGFALAGTTMPQGGNEDIILIKTDSDGNVTE